MIAHGNIRRRPVREEERHAVRTARDEHADRRKLCKKFTACRMNIRRRTQLAPERRRQFRIVLLDVADAPIAEDVIAGIHDARNPPLP